MVITGTLIVKNCWSPRQQTLPESKIGCHEHPHQVFWPWKMLDKFQIPNQQPAKMQQSIENHPKKKTHINNKNYVACLSPPKTRACHAPDFLSEIKERLQKIQDLRKVIFLPL